MLYLVPGLLLHGAEAACGEDNGKFLKDKSCCLSVSPGEGKAVGWRKSLSTAPLQLELVFIFTGEADSGSFSGQPCTKHFTVSAPPFPSACSVFLPLPAFLEVLCPSRSSHPDVNSWELRFLCCFRGKGASTCQGCLPQQSFS